MLKASGRRDVTYRCDADAERLKVEMVMGMGTADASQCSFHHGRHKLQSSLSKRPRLRKYEYLAHQYVAITTVALKGIGRNTTSTYIIPTT